MPTTTTPTGAQRERAVELVQLARATDDAADVIAQELAAVPSTVIEAEQQLLREIVPLLNQLPYSAAPTRRIDSHSIPSHVLAWLRAYREQLLAEVERTTAQEVELRELKSQRAAMRAFLGTDSLD